MAKRSRGGSLADFPFDGASVSDIERTFSAGEMPSAVRELVHPGKDPQDLFMRVVFRDENERNAVIIFLRKCEEFGLDEYIEMLTNWMAATVSVTGRARLELLQATTGVIATALNPSARRDGKRDRSNGDREQ